jgi:cyclohexyl-isocyanide hydratase
LIGDAAFLDWLRGVSPQAVMAAVCGGSLALGAAGFLKGKPATTHPGLMQYLSRFTADVSQERVVDAGNVMTARGVTSAIDLGLYLCGHIAGSEAAEKIRAQMDYPGTISSAKS